MNNFPRFLPYLDTNRSAERPRSFVLSGGRLSYVSAAASPDLRTRVASGFAEVMRAVFGGVVVHYSDRRKEVVQLNGECCGTSEVAGR
jgi:hypothetical protein